MALNVVCAGHLFRHPVGGHTWHHLQYLVGLARLGCRVTFVEHFGWAGSCYDPSAEEMTDDPAYGLAYVRGVFQRVGVQRWCFVAASGDTYGLTREELTEVCRGADLYINLSNVNDLAEAALSRRRVLVDTDPVFVQLGAHGLAALDDYDVLFTYGENVHRPGCAMPTAGFTWLPTRQPVVPDLWPTEAGSPDGVLSTITNWAPLPDLVHEGRLYGQKNREFEAYLDLPAVTKSPFEIAIGGAPPGVVERFRAAGWSVRQPGAISRDPWTYQGYLRASRGEFSVAKHGYVTTQCGWFSDRTCGYLASARPVVVQDTGFSRFLPVGEGLLAFRTHGEAVDAVARLGRDYEGHCRSARALVEEHFDARRVLAALLERSV